jgi:hypothetical protein
VHLLLPFIFALSTLYHEYYVGVFKADYYPKEQRIELTARLFTDDFEQALSASAGKKISLDNPDLHNKLIAQYCTQKMQFTANATKITWRFVGVESDPDVTHVYLEAENLGVIKELQVDIRVFFETLPSQINIFHLRTNGQTQSAYFDKSQPNRKFPL